MEIIFYRFPLRIVEERPYEQCPNCQEWKWREVRHEEWKYDKTSIRAIFYRLAHIAELGEWKVHSKKKECKNCYHTKEN